MHKCVQYSSTQNVRVILVCVLVALTCLFSRWLVTTNAAGNTIIVNSTGDVTNSTDGLCTLREAISAANGNAVSGAAAGECAAGSSSGSDSINLNTLAGTIALGSVLPNISSDMTINGPGSGVLTIQRGSQTFTIFTVSSNATASISGVSMQGGNGSNFGIFNSGNLSLSDCVVSGFGRGVGNGANVLTISNCVISGNTNGGGISNTSGTMNVVNSQVSGNDSKGAFGPGIDNSGTINVSNSTITGNLGHIAIMNGVGSQATFTNTTVSNNTSGGFLNNGTLSMTGGAITGNSTVGMVAASNTLLNGVTISGNTNNSGVFAGGGGIFIGGTATVMNCLITNNSSVFNGGGIRNFGTTTLINSTISGNTSNGSGGGLDSVDQGFGNIIVINVTITNNRAFSGGGVFRESGPLLLRNSLVAGNFRLDGTTPDDIGGTVGASSSFNLIGIGGSGGLTNGVNNNQVGVADPQLGPLQNNGGPTLTHALLPTSSALDAGDNCLTEDLSCGDTDILPITIDQRGFFRPVDGPDADTSAVIDIGAYETQRPLAGLTNTISNEDTQVIAPFDAGDTSSITSITASSDNPTLVSNDPAHLVAALSGTTGIVTINPVANLFGSTNITVTVNRTGGVSENKTFMLTVNSANDAPSFTRGADQSLNEDDPGAQTVTNWATTLSSGPSDESAQSLSFLITNNTNPGLFSSGPAISSAGTLTYTPAANANGLATITVVIKDTGGTANGGADTSAPQTFTINISPVNDAPVFIKGTDQVVNEDSGFNFISTWATVSRGAPNETSQSLTSEVISNTNPGLFSSAPSVSSNGTLSFSTASNANGSATVKMRLKDNGGTGNGGSDTSQEQTFTITLNPVNDAPSFTLGANQTVNNNSGLQSVAAWATNISPGPADESGQTLNFQVTSNSNPGLFTVAPSVSPSGTLSYQPASNAGGIAFLTIRLTDSGGTANGGQDASLPPFFSINVVPIGGSLKFDSATSFTTESSGSTTVTITRTGELTQAVTVDYATSGDPGVSCGTPNGVASPKCDFTSASGSLTFAPAETTKTVTVLLSQDSFIEGPESFTLTLSNQTGGSALASPSTVTVTIADDATEPQANPIDDPGNFVRKHYHDFLNREPDPAGLAFWTNEITSCGSDQTCIEIKRINVSAAFFLSIEFQNTGYFVERIYKAAYGDATGTSNLNGAHQIAVPIIRANEFFPDSQKIGQGIVVGVGNWQQQLDNNKQTFTADFVLRSRFTTAYPLTMSAAEFVDRLNMNAGDPLSQSERDQLVNDLSTNARTRAQVLRAVAEDPELNTAEFNRAFVWMQFVGYLRRNPNDPQDVDYTGFDFWLTKLLQFNGNFVNAEMVKAFITSAEYRQRSGQ